MIMRIKCIHVSGIIYISRHGCTFMILYMERMIYIMKMKSRKFIVSSIIFLLMILIGGYTVWDNQRVVVDNVTMSNSNLPSGFEGYRILQITDLHGKSFGEKQGKLVELIKKQKYDLILFTGDYITDESDDLTPLEDLLKGLPESGDKYYILGNVDEDNSIAPLVSGNKFYDLFAKYGVKPLYPGVEITRGDESIWLRTNPYVGRYEIYQEIPKEIVNAIDTFNMKYEASIDPFTVEVSHIPTEIDYEDEWIHDYRTHILGETDDEWIDWDVSINGHTHGGQIHLPFIGPVASPNYGLFPGKINVTGVHEKNGHTQYVCSGLGVSGPEILQFRFLNPPAIGLITLSKAK